MSTRITKLVERCQKIVGVNDASVTPVDIYDGLNDVQRQISQRLLCLEATSTITTNSSGVASEPTGFYRLKRIVMPDNTYIFPKEIDVEEYDVLEHLLFTNIATRVQYYKRWNGSFTFFPNPGVQTWAIYYYKNPTTTISASDDPEIPEYMDEALFYGTIAQILLYKNTPEAFAASKMYRDMHDREMKTLIERWRATKTNSNTIYYHDI